MENAINYVKIASCIGAAFAIALGTLGPSIGQGLIASKACENIGKYPESANKISTSMLIGLIAVETSSIYALVIAVLLLFAV